MSVRPVDPRRVVHPAAGGLGDAGLLGRRPRVAVVGAGIAGLAAATGLAERGVAVEVLEREPYLGGRVGGWSDTLPDGSPVAMSRGFHAFFRQYYNLRNLLRRGDPGLEHLVPLADYPLVDAEGRRDTFRGLPRTPPWNAVLFALRSPTFRPSDLLRLDPRAAAPLAAVSVPGIYEAIDDVDAQSFLESINFPPAARHLAFEVFSRSFFAPPSTMSAAELATMFHIYFLGSSEGLMFDVPDDGFDAALWEPLRHYLSTRGVSFRTGVAVSSVQRDVASGRFHVNHSSGGTSTGSSTVDAVVLATDVRGLREIVAASPDLGPADSGLGDPEAVQHWRDDVAALGSAPPFLVQRLWLDRPVREDRPPFLGTGGLDPLDNVSVLDRYERDAASWASRHGGSVVELHAYSAAVPDGVDEAAWTADLRARCLARLHELYPETADARITGELVQWRADCPMFGVGDFARRPTVATPLDGLVLAGDGIRIDLPVALMERAAATGWQAANRLLAGWGLAGHPLETVPTGGRLGPLRRAAEYAMRSR
ncbi:MULTISPECIES: FAD-dependent oxidoreductase [unclassified Pseudonocardia]|uniref:FAD-dependent oxidoreductase n=1 Tax=unclassified Pseudonocardia TaxID=2619320 RepID=UPI00094AC415|nr:phi-Carotenoid synthase [Pseudonocardia sp. Ae150A_Ps1]